MTSATAPSRAKAKESASAFILAVLVQGLALVMTTVCVKTFWIEAFVADGPSMEPTLQNGDRFVVDRTAVGLFLPAASESITRWGAPERGDVVIVHSPADELNIIKRVIAVAGDQVEIRDDVVLVNGEPIRVGEAEGCIHGGEAETTVCYEEASGERRWRVVSDSSMTDSLAAREVPEGTVFVLGDHRDRSNDSRNPRIGMVPLTRVVGIARYRYWSETGQPTGWLE